MWLKSIAVFFLFFCVTSTGLAKSAKDWDLYTGLGLGVSSLSADDTRETNKSGQTAAFDFAGFKPYGAFALSGGLGYVYSHLEGDSDLFKNQHYRINAPYVKGGGWWLLHPRLYAGLTLSAVSGIESDFGPTESGKKTTGFGGLELLYRHKGPQASWVAGLQHQQDLTISKRRYSASLLSLGYFWPVRKPAPVQPKQPPVTPKLEIGSMSLKVVALEGITPKAVRYQIKPALRPEFSGMIKNDEMRQFDQMAVGLYEVEAHADGFQSETRTIVVGAGQISHVQIRMISANRFAIRQTIELGVINFEFAKSVLTKDSLANLDKIVKVFKDHKGLRKLSVEGHTDNVGSFASNESLSLARAKAVVDYLLSRGVQDERLEFKGFGSSVPIASNDTEEGRAQNRRVEFVVVELDAN